MSNFTSDNADQDWEIVRSKNRNKSTNNKKSGFFLSKYSNNYKTTQRTGKPFHQKCDREFYKAIEDKSLTISELINYVKNIPNNSEIIDSKPNETNKILTETYTKLLYSSITRIKYYKDNSEYVKLIELLVDKLSEIKKIGNLVNVTRYNEASALMWLDNDIDIDLIKKLLKYLFDKLEIHPFKENIDGENLFGSLITKCERKEISDSVFDARYRLLINNITISQRSKIIKSVINKLSDKLPENCETVIKFKMLFIINPKNFIMETFKIFSENNNNSFSNMKDIAKTVYAPAFVKLLCNLFVDENEESIKIITKLGLEPLFTSYTIIREDDFFNLIKNFLIAFFQINEQICIVNFTHECDQNNNVLKSKLLSISYVISELENVGKCEGLSIIVTKLLCENNTISNDLCFDMCHNILGEKRFSPDIYMQIFKRHGQFSTSKLFTMETYLKQITKEINFGNDIPTIDLILHYLNLIKKNIDDTNISNNANNDNNNDNINIINSDTNNNDTNNNNNNNNTNNISNTNNNKINKKRKKRNNRNKKNRSYVSEYNNIIEKDNKNIIEEKKELVVESMNKIKYEKFYSVDKFDNFCEFDDLTTEVLEVFNTQIRTRDYLLLFTSFIDETLEKSRDITIVDKYVKKIVLQVLNNLLDVRKKVVLDTIETIRRMINNYEIDEDKKEDLPCIEKNFKTIKIEIIKYLDNLEN